MHTTAGSDHSLLGARRKADMILSAQRAPLINRGVGAASAVPHFNSERGTPSQSRALAALKQQHSSGGGGFNTRTAKPPLPARKVRNYALGDEGGGSGDTIGAGYS